MILENYDDIFSTSNFLGRKRVQDGNKYWNDWI